VKTDWWALWVDHVGLSIAYGIHAQQLAEEGEKEWAGLFRWEAARHRYEADRLVERGAR
jgi:hypothetical protein